MEIRRLAVDDLAAARVAGAEAFGGWPPGQTPPALPTVLPEGRFEWGAFDDGRLVARVVTLAFESWWGGRRVPTTGIAGVSVAPEHRGRGLLRPLFEHAVAEALERGEVLSTLFPTAMGIYRGLGYELVTSYDTVEVPTAELVRVSPAGTTTPAVTTRRATAVDLPAVFATYDAWAAAQNGPLTRTGPRFAGRDELLDAVTGVSLAVETGPDGNERVVGFLSWDRGHGYGPEASLTVHDLLATSAEAYRVLWQLAGSFTAVTGRVRISTSGDDPARLVLPTMTWDVVGRHPYMARVLDLPGAVAAIRPSLPGVTRTMTVAVVGDRLGLVEGSWRLTLPDAEGDDPATCEAVPQDEDGVTLTVQGLSLLVAGAQSTGNLRLLGLLTGPDTDDRALDSAVGGRQVHVRDYF